MLLARRIGLGVIALLGLLVWLLGAPSSYSSSGHEDRIAEIKSVDEENNEGAEGAPQQDVVNGWTTNRYLELLAEDSFATRDPRPAALLLLLLLAGCLAWATPVTPPPPRSTPAPPNSGPPRPAP